MRMHHRTHPNPWAYGAVVSDRFNYLQTNSTNK